MTFFSWLLSADGQLLGCSFSRLSSLATTTLHTQAVPGDGVGFGLSLLLCKPF